MSWYWHKQQLARLFHAWRNCFTLLKLGAEVLLSEYFLFWMLYFGANSSAKLNKDTKVSLPDNAFEISNAYFRPFGSYILHDTNAGQETVRCRSGAIQYNMTLRTKLQRLQQILNQSLNSQKRDPISSSYERAMGSPQLGLPRKLSALYLCPTLYLSLMNNVPVYGIIINNTRCTFLSDVWYKTRSDIFNVGYSKQIALADHSWYRQGLKTPG